MIDKWREPHGFESGGIPSIKGNNILDSVGLGPHPSPSYVWETMRDMMRVEERIRQCVVFVGVENDRGVFVPSGTGVLGGITRRGLTFSFLIAAEHVVDGILGDFIFVRINRKEGDSATIKIQKGFKLSHPDSHNDIAVFSISPDATIYEYLQLPLDWAENQKFSENVWSPDCGDEVCTVGLYTSHYGRIKNIPVVRIGHIALMPGEPIRTRKGYVVGYLIETKSIAGLSGSPVFVNVPAIRIKDGEQQFLTRPSYVPLGILVGYHVVESKEDQIPVPQFQDHEGAVEAGAHYGTDERNTGFAVVVPIERVIEILERENVATALDRAADLHFAQSGYVEARSEPEG